MGQSLKIAQPLINIELSCAITIKLSLKTSSPGDKDKYMLKKEVICFSFDLCVQRTTVQKWTRTRVAQMNPSFLPTTECGSGKLLKLSLTFTS